MRSTCLLTVLLLLVSVFARASDDESIAIFINDNSPVEIDIELPRNIELRVYNLDAKDATTKRLSQVIDQRVGKNIQPSELKHAYKMAFSDFMNSPDWEPIYQEMEKGAMAIAEAMRFKIKKVPAIVFNNRQVVYGVPSLRQAVEIYGKQER